MEALEHLYPLLQGERNIVITMHQKPDGDAMGAALGTATLGAPFRIHHGSENLSVIMETAGHARRQELLDRLMDHRVGEAGMMAARARLHLDPDDPAAHERSDRPSREEDERLGGDPRTR